MCTICKDDDHKRHFALPRFILVDFEFRITKIINRLTSVVVFLQGVNKKYIKQDQRPALVTERGPAGR